MRIVCGIDPGLHLTGYAVVRAQNAAFELIDAGICRFSRTKPMAERLADIEADLASIFKEHQPDVLAIENLYAHYKHPRTAILMGHARGVMMLTAHQHGLAIRGYAATRVKRFITGFGRASKSQMQQAVAHMLSLSAPPEPADVADAIAIALCCAAETGQEDATRFRVSM